MEFEYWRKYGFARPKIKTEVECKAEEIKIRKISILELSKEELIANYKQMLRKYNMKILTIQETKQKDT